jgi:hypothetical protein
MQVQAQCAVIMADDTLIDKEHALLSLLKGVFRQQMLGGFTEQIMRQRWHVLGEKISAQGVPLDDEDKKTAPHLKEALEVELALRYKLGESLALPFPIKHMKHLELAEYYMVQSRYGNDLITDEEKIYVIAVIEDKAHAFVLQQENDASLVATSLINQPVWKAYLAQRYAINFARLAYTFSTRKDALVNPYTQSDEDLADEFSVEEKEKFDAAMMTYAHALKVLEDEEEQDQFAFSVKATHALLMKHA